jgi:hypothetical protein
MLRSFKGTWRWHRKAEGGHPPSAYLPLPHNVTVLNILSVQVIEPVEYGRFLYCNTGCVVLRPKVGSDWQFFISYWQSDRDVMVLTCLIQPRGKEQALEFQIRSNFTWWIAALDQSMIDDA